MEQWTWEDLLSYGRGLLSSFEKGLLSNKANVTGIEDHILQSDYLMQLLRLNNYMFTTGSTNEPDALFQPMWIEGYLHREDALALTKILRQMGIYYVVQDPITSNNIAIYTGPDANLLNPKDLGEILVGQVGALPREIEDNVAEIMPEFVGMIIEDPVLERKTLYKTLWNFFAGLSNPI